MYSDASAGRPNPFVQWLKAQYALETKFFNNDPAELGQNGGSERKDFFRWNAFALEDELHEAAAELAWKPWASSDHFNRASFIAELADVMFFLGNIVLLAVETLEGECILRDGMTAGRYVDVQGIADELWEAYSAKVEVNQRRMMQGYDGVSDKCPVCRRELQLIDHPSQGGIEIFVCPQHGAVDPEEG